MKCKNCGIKLKLPMLKEKPTYSWDDFSYCSEICCHKHWLKTLKGKEQFDFYFRCKFFCKCEAVQSV